MNSIRRYPLDLTTWMGLALICAGLFTLIGYITLPVGSPFVLLGLGLAFSGAAFNRNDPCMSLVYFGTAMAVIGMVVLVLHFSC